MIIAWWMSVWDSETFYGPYSSHKSNLLTTFGPWLTSDENCKIWWIIWGQKDVFVPPHFPMGMQVSVNGQMQLRPCCRLRLARRAFCYILNFSYHILLLAAYRAWKIWNNYKPPPFYSYFRPEEETTKCKKMNYESRNIMLKMLIWICSILPCLVICDAFISQINLGLTIDCCNLNCSIVNQSSCKLCSTLTRISFNYSRMFLHYLFTD